MSTAQAKQTAPRAGADERVRQGRGRQRRQQILDAAVELFSEGGYRGTGVAALADRVGMTAPGLLYYFGSKDRLLREVVAERDRATPDPDDFDLRFADLRGVGRHNEAQEELTRLYIVLGAESFDDSAPLHDFFTQRYDQTRSFVRDLLLRERDDGALRAGVDVDQIAREVVGVLIGFEVQWLTDPEHFDYGTAVETYIDRLVSELLT